MSHSQVQIYTLCAKGRAPPLLKPPLANIAVAPTCLSVRVYLGWPELDPLVEVPCSGFSFFLIAVRVGFTFHSCPGRGGSFKSPSFFGRQHTQPLFPLKYGLQFLNSCSHSPEVWLFRPDELFQRTPELPCFQCPKYTEAAAWCRREWPSRCPLG